MKCLTIAATVFLFFGCGEANWGPSSVKPCETHQENYQHTTISCGDYFDDVIVLCDANANYNRGPGCLKMSDFYDVVAENKPCSDCGCVVENICEN